VTLPVFLFSDINCRRRGQHDVRKIVAVFNRALDFWPVLIVVVLTTSAPKSPRGANDWVLTPQRSADQIFIHRYRAEMAGDAGEQPLTVPR
jgi:hypothetical protein